MSVSWHLVRSTPSFANFPLKAAQLIWKEEVYFEIPVKMGEEKAKPTVEIGTIAFWPMGSAFAYSTGHHSRTAL